MKAQIIAVVEEVIECEGGHDSRKGSLPVPSLHSFKRDTGLGPQKNEKTPIFPEVPVT